jgi:amidase
MDAAAELLCRPATELAGLVARGDVTSRELVQASLDRIAALDGEVNAFVDVFAEEALAEAEAIGARDGRPFAGVPIAIKNNRPIAGRRLTVGSDFFGDFAAPVDHNVVARLRRAGFVLVGTTTLPEFGILPATETRRFGPTRNPWDPSRTPGGSSGGSAAAVAAGMVPIAHANDGGGSTRIPAACCGLVGLKPQRGRISVAPEVGFSFLVQDGVLTRTVAETAQLLDLLAGAELGDAAWAPPPAEPFAVGAAREPGRRRIALALNPPLPDAQLDPVIEAATRDAAALLESLGHDVEEVQAPWSDAGMLRLFTASFGPAVCLQIAFAALLAGREPRESDMEPLSWAIWELCQGITSVQAAAAEVRLQAFARGLITWADPYDAILTPALAEAPVPIGVLDPQAPEPMRTFARSGASRPYTAVANVTGSPAISLPIAARPEGDAAPGLPIGIQLIGRPRGRARCSRSPPSSRPRGPGRAGCPRSRSAR